VSIGGSSLPRCVGQRSAYTALVIVGCHHTTAERHRTRVLGAASTAERHRTRVLGAIPTADMHRTCLVEAISTADMHRTCLVEAISTADMHRTRVLGAMSTADTHRTPELGAVSTADRHRSGVHEADSTAYRKRKRYGLTLPNGEAQPAARRVQRCEPPRAVGIHQDEKSQREGGRLQRGLGGAAGVDASRSAHIRRNDFGSALHTDAHGKNEPCRVVKPKAKRDVAQRRSVRTGGEEEAESGWRATVGRREKMMDALV
jgi:hypothetical protein